MSLNSILPLLIYVPMVCLTVAGVICPQFGSKDSANRRQNKIKVQKLLFFLLRCRLSGAWWKADIGSFAVVLRQAVLHEVRPYIGGYSTDFTLETCIINIEFHLPLTTIQVNSEKNKSLKTSVTVTRDSYSLGY